MEKGEDKRPMSAEDGEMLPEYDFESPDVVQGRSYRKVQELRRRRLLSPEMAEKFRDDQAVNEALEEYLKLKRESA